MNRSVRLAPGLLLVAALVSGWGVAQADCVGPTFSHTGGDVAHGETVTVTGYGFGDNCYDTGPPPPGEGSLGRPLTDIEIYLEQGGRLHLVAVGNADQDYEWEAEIPIPAVLDVGEARVAVMSSGFEAFNEDPRDIWVTGNGDEGASIEPVTFGPAASEAPDAPEAVESFAGTNWTPLIALIGAAIAVGAGLVVLQRRSTS